MRTPHQRFLSTLSLRRATGCVRYCIHARAISIHTLLAESDVRQVDRVSKTRRISIHTLLAESDSCLLICVLLTGHFYPHSPCGERRVVSSAGTTGKYFYPHSPCGERPGQNLVNGVRRVISIHTLLAESDKINPASHTNLPDFYPHSPCGERQMYALKLADFMLFLSTLSLRRATQVTQTCREEISISIHTLLAESDQAKAFKISPLCISIHTLLAESDFRHCTTYLNCSRFLSTLSLRRATTPARMSSRLLEISIHTLLAESDGKTPANIMSHLDFYPHSPCGERHVYTHPIGVLVTISIHTLLAESDLNPPKPRRFHYHFYPHSPCGERRQKQN